jgi:hypothetical protein
VSGEHWLLDVLRAGISPTNEANTSRYVHEALVYCLDWPWEYIRPQASKRGYIDYELKIPQSNMQIHVEVKPFGKPLNSEMIRKYIVRRGREREDFRVGILTNLARWQVFLAGPEVTRTSGAKLVRLLNTQISSRADIYGLRRLIGFRNNGRLREIRAALSEVPEVVSHVLREPDAINAIRQQLRVIRERKGLDFGVPHVELTSDTIRRLTKGVQPSGLKFDVQLFRDAICSTSVAEVISDKLVERFDSRSRANQVKQTLKGVFDLPE